MRRGRVRPPHCSPVPACWCVRGCIRSVPLITERHGDRPRRTPRGRPVSRCRLRTAPAHCSPAFPPRSRLSHRRCVHVSAALGTARYLGFTFRTELSRPQRVAQIRRWIDASIAAVRGRWRLARPSRYEADSLHRTHRDDGERRAGIRTRQWCRGPRSCTATLRRAPPLGTAAPIVPRSKPSLFGHVSGHERLPSPAFRRCRSATLNSCSRSAPAATGGQPNTAP